MNVPRLAGSRRSIGRDELVVITADDKQALAAIARDAAARANEADRPVRDWAADITATHAGGALALAVVGNSCGQMADKLRHAAERLGDPSCTRINDRSGIFFTAAPLHPVGGRIAVLFPGEGSQYPGMLGDLCMRFGAARQAFDRADRAFENHPRGLLPSQLAFGDAAADRIWDMDSAVEMVFSGNAAVHAVLGTLGLRPDVFVGHSTGDYSALFASGAIEAADDGEIVRLMLGLNAVYEDLAKTAAMPERALLAVGAGDAAVIERVLESVPGLDLAMDNCPHQRVLCGAPEALAQARERLASDGAIVEELAFRRGYHTDAFRPALPVLQPFFDALPLQAPAVELWSCASAARVPEDLEQLRQLALEQWAMPVRFTETVLRLWDEGVRIFVESGPRGNLTAFIKDILRDKPHLAVACDGMNKPTVTHLMFALGQLAAHGVPLDLAALAAAPIAAVPSRRSAAEKGPRRNGPVMTLATGWPDLRLSAETATRLAEKFAPAPSTSAPAPSASAPAPSAPAPAPSASVPAPPASVPDERAALMATHLAVTRRMIQAQERVLMTFLGGSPLGGSPQAPAQPAARLLSGARLHRDGESLIADVRLSLERHPFLRHHTLGGGVSAADPSLTALPVMPFTMTLELAAEAAGELVAGQVCVGFENVVARRWIALDSGDHVDLQVTAVRGASLPDGVATVAVEIGNGRGESHFSAIVRMAPSYASAPVVRSTARDSGSPWDRDRVYRKAMFHGPLFQGIERVTHLDASGADAILEVVGRSGLLADGEPAFAVDPVLLDQPGQVVGVWTADRLPNGFVIFPTRLARLDLFSPALPAGSRLACHATIRLTGEAGVTSDLDIADGAGRLQARFIGWEDKRFDVPASFLAFMLDPLHASLCRPWMPSATARAEASGVEGVHIARADLPTGFAARGGIWQQVLAGLTLSRGERATWHGSISAGADAAPWLLCRVAAKDAVRRWLAQRELAVPPADIVISDGLAGAMQASGQWVSVVGGPIDLGVEIVNDDAVAVVRTRPGQPQPRLPRVTAGAAGAASR